VFVAKHLPSVRTTYCLCKRREALKNDRKNEGNTDSNWPFLGH